MKKLRGARARAAFIATGALALALATAGPALAVTGTPVTPTDAFNNGAACATDQSNPYWTNPSTWLTVEARPDLSDVTGTTDGSYGVMVTEQFQVYPVDDPTQITSYSISGSAQVEGVLDVPGTVFADGETYVWQAQTIFDGVSSDWSAPCYVAIDKTAPSVAPTVVSTNYPSGVVDQAGAPIHLTFGANGVSDVKGFSFSWDGPGGSSFGAPLSDPFVGTAGSVLADSLGGSATVDLVPADPSQVMTLYVTSIDRAGNGSPETAYRIVTTSTDTTVTPLATAPMYGKQLGFKLSPDAGLEAASPVTAYTVTQYTSTGQQTTTVPAGADGTAVLTYTLDDPSGISLQVNSVSADGWIGSPTSYQFSTAPTISSAAYPENGTAGGAGVPGIFTIQSPVKGVVSFTYTFDFETFTTVAAQGGDRATICWTPPDAGSYDLEVYANTADGSQLAVYDYFFNVG
ncbi:hypothetical protein KDL01_25545 [Actinospica durhamensis]|uniref:Uncharacterized protein n=1 Tax=Actinospica durhamensis TaxID=1508375 RepID=A0A941IPL3_9ACTN|nr:hypothetical protein [Actinospica durhamensis]MBR7836670.1 hypothetical protein [Actinospica durhamensis]